MKGERREDMKVKGVTKEGVDEPVTVADSEANRVRRLSRRLSRPVESHPFCR